MMEKTVYMSVTEWDIGMGTKAYESLAELESAQRTALKLYGVDDPFEELKDEGLVGFETITLISPGEQLDRLRTANMVRQANWPGGQAASDPLFRAIEFAGEAGELMDALKKLLREQRGIAGNAAGTGLRDRINGFMEEVGDVVIALDLLCGELGIEIADCVPMKFNKTSAKVGVNVFMDGEWNWGTASGSADQPDLFDDGV